MVATALEIYSYIKAPKLTFALKHPGKALKVAKTRWDMKHAYAPRIAAAGAAMLALPAGYAAGRVGRGGSTVRHGLAAALVAMPIGYLIGRVAASETRAQARAARWRRDGAPRGRGRELSEPRTPVVGSHDDERSGRRVPPPSTLAASPEDRGDSITSTDRDAAAPEQPTRAGAP